MKRLSIEYKVLGMACLLYLAVSITCSILLTLIWQVNTDTSNQTYQQLTQLAEQSPFITIGSALIGVFSSMLIAAFITFRASKQGLQVTYFAGVLILYGTLSIALHPDASFIMNLLKLLSPAPLCYFGYLIAIKYQQKSQPQHLVMK